MTSNKISLIITCLAFIGSLCLSSESEASLCINSDFQTGDLSGWKMQHSLNDVTSSELIDVTETSPGQYAASLLTGYTNYGGITSCTIYQSISLSPASTELTFDYRFTDMGPDTDGTKYPDCILVSYDQNDNKFTTIIEIDDTELLPKTLFPVISNSILSNGFKRISIDISNIDKENINLYIDLKDSDDGRLTKADIDNVIIPVPEPTTVTMLLSGILFTYSKRKRNNHSA